MFIDWLSIPLYLVSFSTLCLHLFCIFIFSGKNQYRKCCVEGCKESSHNLTLHKFPKTEGMRQKWSQICPPKGKKPFVCSRHFREEDYKTKNLLSKRRQLNKLAVPCLNLLPPLLLEQPVPFQPPQLQAQPPPLTAQPPPLQAQPPPLPAQPPPLPAQPPPLQAQPPPCLNRPPSSLHSTRGVQCTRVYVKDYRPQLLQAKRKISQLRSEILKLNTKKREKAIVKNFLLKQGHSLTATKHIMSRHKSHRKKYTHADVSLGLILKNMSNKAGIYVYYN